MMTVQILASDNSTIVQGDALDGKSVYNKREATGYGGRMGETEPSKGSLDAGAVVVVGGCVCCCVAGDYLTVQEQGCIIDDLLVFGSSNDHHDSQSEQVYVWTDRQTGIYCVTTHHLSTMAT